MTALNKQALRDSALDMIRVLGYIASFESEDIDGDDLELRFETEDGFDTGCTISITSQCQDASDVMQQLLNELEAAERRIAELEARAFNPAILDVIAERQRQQSVEGWTPEHDNVYQNSELADAAACYAIHAHNQGFSTPAHWPWSPDWWKQSGARRDLVKAGALIIAEIERIDRAAGIGVKGE
ncbi:MULTISPECIES: ead/Ea22-like family protein [Salmonella]|uniref:ead/Ea22-like family protein n=1 Tax=Salmonella enterica TaxID=28901 RepID=UPI001EDE321F|nr:ead/Ea22-like family protein [Salmonella enterica]